MRRQRIPEHLNHRASPNGPLRASARPRRMGRDSTGYVWIMAKSPREMSDDELVDRLRADEKEIRPGRDVERNAPVDLENDGIELDQDGVRD